MALASMTSRRLAWKVALVLALGAVVLAVALYERRPRGTFALSVAQCLADRSTPLPNATVAPSRSRRTAIAERSRCYAFRFRNAACPGSGLLTRSGVELPFRGDAHRRLRSCQFVFSAANRCSR